MLSGSSNLPPSFLLIETTEFGSKLSPFKKPITYSSKLCGYTLRQSPVP